MRFDDTAAAYDLFQVVFADLADHLAVAAFRLRGKELGLSVQEAFGDRVSDTLQSFREQLGQFDERSPVSDSVRDLRPHAIQFQSSRTGETSASMPVSV